MGLVTRSPPDLGQSRLGSSRRCDRQFRFGQPAGARTVRHSSASGDPRPAPRSASGDWRHAPTLTSAISRSRTPLLLHCVKYQYTTRDGGGQITPVSNPVASHLRNSEGSAHDETSAPLTQIKGLRAIGTAQRSSESSDARDHRTGIADGQIAKCRRPVARKRVAACVGRSSGRR